jgi:hypothetical protein
MYPTSIRLSVLLACAMCAPLHYAAASELLTGDSDSQGLSLGLAEQLGSTVVDPAVLPASSCDVCESCDVCAPCGDCGCSCWSPLEKTVSITVPCWQPIDLCCNLTDGWCDPFVGGPVGSSGAPRQGWLATPDGFFTKEFHLYYGLTTNNNGTMDIHTGMFQFQYPISRRLWFGLDAPYSSRVDRGTGLPDLTDFDDVTLTGKVLLHETQNFGLTAQLGTRVPTGSEEMGGGITALSPAIAQWSDIGDGWSLRSGAGVDIGTGGVPDFNSDTDMLYTVAIGRTITPHDYTPLGDFTYYTAINGRTGLAGVDPHTFLFITPGIRTHLGHNLFFLTAAQIPVTGPTSFDSNLMFMLVKGI